MLLIDTGPLVALLNLSDRHHGWTVELLRRIDCETVLSEACYLLGRAKGGPAALVELVSRGVVIPNFSLKDQATAVAKLMATYVKVPMSLADACLVRMPEIHVNSKVITLDSDFTVYRRRSRQLIPHIMPG